MFYATDMNVICENSRWKLAKSFEQPERLYVNNLFDLLLNLEHNQMPDLNPFIQETVPYLKYIGNYWDLYEEYLLLTNNFSLF